MCLTEPGAGSDVGRPEDDGEEASRRDLQHHRARRCFISCGDHDLAENIIHPVLARIEGDPPGTGGISIFIVPKYRVNADGSVGRTQRRPHREHRAQDGHQGLGHLHAEFRRRGQVRRRTPRQGARGDEGHVPDDERGASRGRHAGARSRLSGARTCRSAMPRSGSRACRSGR
ncbi:MAG: hypothetical protein MZV49_25640 [Rhodopseudomonas palustris]|nr:hypothetical protein [Rhodopseudomonas palustris]